MRVGSMISPLRWYWRRGSVTMTISASLKCGARRPFSGFLLARGLAQIEGLKVQTPQTNLVFVDTEGVGLTAEQLAERLGISRETVRRLAIAGALPHTVVCRGTRKTTRRSPRRFADDFAASGLDLTDLDAFADAWRARVTAPAR